MSDKGIDLEFERFQMWHFSKFGRRAYPHIFQREADKLEAWKAAKSQTYPTFQDRVQPWMIECFQVWGFRTNGAIQPIGVNALRNSPWFTHWCPKPETIKPAPPAPEVTL